MFTWATMFLSQCIPIMQDSEGDGLGCSYLASFTSRRGEPRCHLFNGNMLTPQIGACKVSKSVYLNVVLVMRPNPQATNTTKHKTPFVASSKLMNIDGQR
jgi:hypothetical protein